MLIESIIKEHEVVNKLLYVNNEYSVLFVSEPISGVSSG